MNNLPLLSPLLKGLAVIVLLVLATLLLGDLIDRHWIDVYVRGRGLTGVLLFLLAASLLISVGSSRQLIAFLAGYGFGFGAGLLLSMLAAIAGCIVTFYVARDLLRGFLQRHATARMHEVNRFIHHNTFSMTLVLRLLPVGSNFLVNLAAGAFSVRGLPFFLGSALGYVPQMLVFTLLGSGSQVQEVWQLAIAVAMFVIATLLGAWLFGRYRRQQRPSDTGANFA